MNDKTLFEKPLDLVGPKIAVIGVGGAGSNAVDNMIRMGLKGVTFIVSNTDAQALSQSLCEESKRVRLGFGVTRGLGAGSSPDVGRSAAEESLEEIKKHLEGINMLFVTAGMGGGTGTGGAPVIADTARKLGILTVGVVTKPFHFEGQQRMRAAEKGIEAIKECVDTLLVIPNQNLFRLATETTTFSQAFAMADDVLYSGVRTFTDLMIKPGLVNLDFADICTVMKNVRGKAMMGTGEATGENRAVEASEKAICGLLLEDVTISGAEAVLINITGGPDLTLYEVDAAIDRVKREVENEDFKRNNSSHIIFGATFDSEMKGVRVSVVATGISDGGEYDLRGTMQEEKSAVRKEALSESPDTELSQHLGNRHGNFSFDYQEEFLPQSPSQHSSDYLSGDHPAADRLGGPAFQGHAETTKSKKRSFFNRFTRFRRSEEETFPKESPEPYRNEGTPYFPPSSGRNFPEEAPPKNREGALFGEETNSTEDISIPAFLRDKRQVSPPSRSSSPSSQGQGKNYRK